MPSIYEMIDLDRASGVVPVDRGPMPIQLTMMGCGRHRFEQDDEGSYWCLNVGCPTVIRPGQLLHGPLREAIG